MNNRELLFILKARNSARGVIQQFRQQLKQLANAAQTAQKALKGVATATRAFNVEARKSSAALKVMATASRNLRTNVRQIQAAATAASNSTRVLGTSAIKAQQNLNSLAAGARRASVELRKARTAMQTTAASANTLGVSSRAAAAGLRSVGKVRVGQKLTAGINKARNAMRGLVASVLSLRGILAGFTIAILGRAAFTALSDFGDEMTRVKIISGATAAQFLQLEDRARSLGQTTRFTAVEAAEGMSFLARAGFDATEVIAGIGPALDLATIAAIDLGRSADILSNIMSTFSISTSRAADVTDVLTFVANSSNTSIEQLGQAFKFVGPIAQAVGFDINEVSAAIGALGNSGLQATLAGTGLRIAMQRLLAPAKNVRRAIADLGIDLNEINPSLVDLVDIFKRLKQAQEEVGKQKFAEKITTVFSARGSTAALAILNNLEDFIRLEKESRKQAGLAARNAREFEDTLGGTTDKLIASLTDLVLAFGASGLTAVIRGLFDVVINLARSLTTLIDQFKLTEEAADDLQIALRALGTAGFIFLVTILTGPIGGAIALVVLGLFELSFSMVKLEGQVIKLGLVFEFIFNKIVALVQNLVRPIFQILLAIGQALFSLGAALIALVQLDFDEFKANIKALFRDFGRDIDEAVDKFRDNMDIMQETLDDFLGQRTQFELDIGVGGNIGDPDSDFKGSGKPGPDGSLADAQIKDIKESIKALRSAFAPGLAAQAEFNEQQEELTSLVGRSDKALKAAGVTRQELAAIQIGLNKARDDEINFLRAGNRELAEELKLIGLVGVERQIAIDRIQAEAQARERDPAGDGSINERDFEIKAALRRAEAQGEFLEELKNTIKEQRIEAALIGETETNVERLIVALEVLEDAKAAGFDPEDARRLAEQVVESFDEIQDAIDKFNEDSAIGIKRAFETYIEEAKNFADQFEQLTTNAIKSVEDALTEFITKGKLDFKSLIDSIVEDLVRIQVKRALGSLFEALGLGGEATKTGADKIAQQAQEIANAAEKVKIAVDISGNRLAVGLDVAGVTASQALQSNAQVAAIGLRVAGVTTARGITEGGDLVVKALKDVAKNISNASPANDNRQLTSVSDVPLDIGVGGGGIGGLLSVVGQTENLGTGGAIDAVAMSGADDLEAVLQDFSGDMGVVTDQAISDMTDNFNTLDFSFNSIFSSIGSILDGSSSLFKGGGFFGGLTSGTGGGFFSDIGASLAGGDLFSFLGFAKGGVLKNGGAARLSKLAEGGIVTDPTLAMFGEGDRAEAFVPLPDGRRIPVEMTGPPGRVVNLTTNMTVVTQDASSFGRNQDQIARRAGLTFQRALGRDN